MQGHRASRARYVSNKPVRLGIGGTQHTVATSIEDRGHMVYPVLLGRDILSEYRVDVEKRVSESGSGSAPRGEE